MKVAEWVDKKCNCGTTDEKHAHPWCDTCGENYRDALIEAVKLLETTPVHHNHRCPSITSDVPNEDRWQQCGCGALTAVLDRRKFLEGLDGSD